MTVAELKAILDTLPDDASVFVNHERIKLHPPELFFSDHSVLVIVPNASTAHNDAQERPHWRHLQKPSLE